MTDKYIVRLKGTKDNKMERVIYARSKYDLIDPLPYAKWKLLGRDKQVYMGYNKKRADELAEFLNEHGDGRLENCVASVRPVK